MFMAFCHINLLECWWCFDHSNYLWHCSRLASSLCAKDVYFPFHWNYADFYIFVSMLSSFLLWISFQNTATWFPRAGGTEMICSCLALRAHGWDGASHPGDRGSVSHETFKHVHAWWGDARILSENELFVLQVRETFYFLPYLYNFTFILTLILAVFLFWCMLYSVVLLIKLIISLYNTVIKYHWVMFQVFI